MILLVGLKGARINLSTSTPTNKDPPAAKKNHAREIDIPINEKNLSRDPDGWLISYEGLFTKRIFVEFRKNSQQFM